MNTLSSEENMADSIFLCEGSVFSGRPLTSGKFVCLTIGQSAETKTEHLERKKS